MDNENHIGGLGELKKLEYHVPDKGGVKFVIPVFDTNMKIKEISIPFGCGIKKIFVFYDNSKHGLDLHRKYIDYREKVKIRLTCTNEKCSKQPTVEWIPTKESYASEEVPQHCSYCEWVMEPERIKNG